MDDFNNMGMKFCDIPVGDPDPDAESLEKKDLNRAFGFQIGAWDTENDYEYACGTGDSVMLDLDAHNDPGVCLSMTFRLDKNKLLETYLTRSSVRNLHLALGTILEAWEKYNE